MEVLTFSLGSNLWQPSNLLNALIGAYNELAFFMLQ